MSFSREIKSQGALRVSTESGIVDITPAGDTINLGKAVTFGDPVASLSNLGGQPADEYLSQLSSTTPTSGQVLKYNGSQWVADDDTSNSYTAGDGLALNAGEFSLDSSVAGDGLAHASGVLSVGVDNATVEVSGDALRVKAGGVSGTELATGAVTSLKIANDSVGSQHYVAASVDNTALADGAVSAGKIIDGEVTAGKLASDAVVEAKIAAGAVTTAKLASGLELSSPVVNQSALSFNSANAGASHLHEQHHFTTANDTQSDHSILTLGTGDRYLVDVLAVANDQTDGAVGCYSARFAVKNDAGTASILGSTNVALEYEEANSAAWSVDFGVSGADLQAQLVGDSSNSVRWSVAVKAVRCN